METLTKQQIRQQLSTLQTWQTDTAVSTEKFRQSYFQETKTFEEKFNTKFHKQVTTEYQKADADTVASGITETRHAAPKESLKEKSEKKRKEKAAKKMHPDATHISYDIQDSLNYYDNHYNNSLKAMPSATEAQCQKNGINKNILKAFSQGHRATKKGKPLDSDEEAIRQQDLAFYSDYSSAQLERRKPHLDRIVNTILSSPVTPDLFSNAFMKSNAGGVFHCVQQLELISDIMSDPVNQPYFDSLPEDTIGLLYHYRSVASFYQDYLQKYLGSHAIDYKTGKYFPWRQGSAIYTKADSFQPSMHNLVFSLQPRWKEKFAIMHHIKSQELSEISEERKRDFDANPEGEWSQLNLTSFTDNLSFEAIAGCRTLIESQPALYQKHKALVDKSYQDVYRCVDLMGDYKLAGQASATVANSFSGSLKLTTEQTYLLTLSDQKSEEAARNAHTLFLRASSATNLISYLLDSEGKVKLSNAATFYMEQIGYDKSYFDS